MLVCDLTHTVFPRIVSAESILFRSCQLRLLNEGGYYTRAATIELSKRENN